MCLSRDAGFEGRGVAETAEAALASPYTTMKLAAQAEFSFFFTYLNIATHSRGRTVAVCAALDDSAFGKLI